MGVNAAFPAGHSIRGTPAAAVRVEDPADPRVADYVALTDTALRRRVEPAQGLFIAESEVVVRRAVAAGYRLRSLLVLPRHADTMADVAGRIPVYLAGPDVLQAITGFDVHRGVLAAVERRPLPSPAGLLAAARRVVIVEDMNNPTNLGSVLRSAAALGYDAVLLSPRSADPLYRRSVRVSMGAALVLPHARLAPWPEGLGQVRAAGFLVLALTPEPDAVSIDDVDPALPRLALLVGAEGPGLSAGALEAADVRARIPMAPGVDSLNVAAAAAIACYALRPR
jgi:tRNA G18 (ribose-2'-O)-methylase SpoU